jgi:uncharacterized protein (TIGR03382 family)
MTDLILAVDWGKDGAACSMTTALPLFVLTGLAILGVRRKRKAA